MVIMITKILRLPRSVKWSNRELDSAHVVGAMPDLFIQRDVPADTRFDNRPEFVAEAKGSGSQS